MPRMPTADMQCTADYELATCTTPEVIDIKQWAVVMVSMWFEARLIPIARRCLTCDIPAT